MHTVKIMDVKMKWNLIRGEAKVSRIIVHLDEMAWSATQKGREDNKH